MAEFIGSPSRTADTSRSDVCGGPSDVARRWPEKQHSCEHDRLRNTADSGMFVTSDLFDGSRRRLPEGRFTPEVNLKKDETLWASGWGGGCTRKVLVKSSLTFSSCSMHETCTDILQPAHFFLAADFCCKETQQRVCIFQRFLIQAWMWSTAEREGHKQVHNTPTWQKPNPKVKKMCLARKIVLSTKFFNIKYFSLRKKMSLWLKIFLKRTLDFKKNYFSSLAIFFLPYLKKICE